MIDFVGAMYRAGVSEEAERASKAFAEGVEMFKKLGASPEDIAKFKALYPTQDNINNNHS